MNNQSLLSATGADHDEAAYVTRRLPGISPETIMGVDQYEYVMSAVIHGKRSTPFRVRGVPVDAIYVDYYDPAGVPRLQRQIDATLGRQPIGKILAAQTSLDGDIAAHLAQRSSGS
jgi:hypothetical protein